jgi:hypothetical protein
MPSDPMARQMLRALGVVTCDRCYRALMISAGRRGWIERTR